MARQVSGSARPLGDMSPIPLSGEFSSTVRAVLGDGAWTVKRGRPRLRLGFVGEAGTGGVVVGSGSRVVSDGDTVSIGSEASGARGITDDIWG